LVNSSICAYLCITCTLSVFRTKEISWYWYICQREICKRPFWFVRKNMVLDELFTKRNFMFAKGKEIPRERPETIVKPIPNSRKIHNMENTSVPYIWPLYFHFALKSFSVTYNPIHIQNSNSCLIFPSYILYKNKISF
jgi:hypothetical protein